MTVKPNFAAALCAAVVIAVGVALFLLDRAAYLAVIDHWSFYPVAKPFIDAEYVTSQIQCWRQGVDVYVTNPCDTLGRLQNLSPLWLRLPFWPVEVSATNRLGLTIDLCFAASLLALPRLRTAWVGWPVILGLISPVVVFALERANQDVIMFALLMLAIMLLERSAAARIAGYCLIMLAGLMKFYPLVAMSLALSERPKWFAALATTCIAILAAFIFEYSAELKAMAPNIPYAPAFELGIGATRLPMALGTALATILHMPALATNPAIRIASLAILVAALLLIAMRTSERLDFASLTQREMLCLVAGAALICGCFLTGRSAMYRGIHLLLVLPGLIVLAAHAQSRACRVLKMTIATILLSMFSLPMHRLPGESFRVFADQIATPIASLDWICRELMWWWIVAILLAVLLRFVATSTVWRALHPQP